MGQCSVYIIDGWAGRYGVMETGGLMDDVHGRGRPVYGGDTDGLAREW